jgi:predicted restriction endonuclease
VTNRLVLCKLHHVAFDRHTLGIRPDLHVVARAAPHVLEIPGGGSTEQREHLVGSEHTRTMAALWTSTRLRGPR